MCVIVAKKFKDIGWVLAKNRDRNYVPTINIVQNNRRSIQRLYIDDEKTRYTEGVNEFGVSIVSSSLAVKKDEKEGEKATPNDDDTFFSPDGKKIRTALFEKTPEKALKALIETGLSGCALIANEENCYLLEGSYDENDEYFYKTLKIKDYCVRTNHGVLLPKLGYEGGKERKSSLVRKDKTETLLKTVDNYEDILNALSIHDDKDFMMNPLRHGDYKKKEMMTTGQIVIEPKHRVLRYRPIHSDVIFKNTKINTQEAKTFFEIISTRKLMGFKEFVKNSQNADK